MPVYNCEGYVQEAINSILNQTYRDFELLIIDDASTDKTLKLVKEFTDPRLKIIEKQINTGYTDSLNMGLKIARGELIARMDGDDISFPKRFELQVQAFKDDTDLVLCGSSMEIIGSKEILKFPLEHQEIKVALLNICCIGHPTVMFKNDFLKVQQLNYDKAKEPAEDFNLWIRMMIAGATMKNIAGPLVKYRVHENQTSQKKYIIQQISGFESKILYLSSIVNKSAAAKFYSTSKLMASKNMAKEFAHLNWLEKENEYLKKQNKTVCFFAEKQFVNFLEQHKKYVVRTVFLNSTVYGPAKAYFFIKYILKNPGYFSLPEIIRNIAKCIVFYKINERLV